MGTCVSSGVSWLFYLLRQGAQCCEDCIHDSRVNKAIFSVVRYRAERCETAKMDFKSPAYAIPPPGPGMAKLSYQIANGNMGRMELASKRSWLNADAVRCDGSSEN
jgi:hypothetical protein